jgi:hypothetical protein
MKKDGIKANGHRGTWYVISERIYNGEKVYLLEHETYGEDAPHIIVNGDGDIVLEDVHNGFDDLT